MHSERSNIENDENNLLIQIAAGDEKAFRKIFDRYKDPFYAAAFKMTRSNDVAEEIVQEVFIKLWVNRIKVAKAENPAGYLFKILYNSIYIYFKKLALEKRMMKIVGRQFLDSENPVENMLLNKEDKLFLEKVISMLTPLQQEVYKLSKQDGLSREEIAQYLHISPHTVKNHLLKAVKFIRRNLKEAIVVMIWFTILENL